MKIPSRRLVAGAVLLVACTLPLSAAGKRDGSGPRQPNATRGINPGHKKSEAEKDARQTRKDVEREDARKEREAQLLKRFDANGDGKLDATEKAAMEAALEKRQEKRDKK